MENNLPNPISQLTDLLSIISEEDEENEGSGTTTELTTQSNLTDEFGLFENYPNWEKSVETSMQQLVDMFNKQVSEIEKEHQNPIPNEFEEQFINKFKEKYVKPSKEKDNSKLPKLLHIHEPFKLSPLSSSHSLSQIEGGFTVQITPLQDSRTTNTNHQKEGRSEGGIPTQIMHKYADFSITSQKPLLVDRFKETTNNNVIGSTGSPKLPPASGRPPFAGLTGGGPPQQLIPSGKPWPARPEDYADFSITSQKPQLVDRFKETTNKDKSSNSTANDVMGSSGSSKLPSASGRPPFAGLTGGGPPQQLIPSGKPWPARPEDYADFSITSQKPQLVDRFKETTNKDKSSNSTSNDVMGLSGPPKLPSASGRPPFAGLTGGGPPQQQIPSGKPWPARPEDYADFSITSQKPQLIDRLKETTNKDKSSNSTANDVMGLSGPPKLPSASDRPPFAGLTGGGPPQQLIPSGKPWPARPEDYADFSITSQKPQLIDRFKETTNKDKFSNSMANAVMGLSGSPKLPSASGRPPFAGLTGGGPPQQQIPSGKPWPARPEDYNLLQPWNL
nr:polycystic kidney disease protein 1-like 3 [Leptinotarsa decemlineata]